MTGVTSALLCSDAALLADDDLRGSAARFSSFLLIEQRGSFGREAAEDALRELAPDLADSALAIPGFRPFAIRPVGRPDVAEQSGTSSIRARFAGRAGTKLLRSVTGMPALADLGAPGPSVAQESAPSNGGEGPGTRPATAEGSLVSEPLFAICTNGSRDRCCAIKGRNIALFLSRELDSPSSDDESVVVEVSHLGGHRFAPTLLVLPTGYAYGRLDPDTALEIAYAAQDGLIDPRQLRGRADLEPAAQVADAMWRSEIGEPSPLDAVTSIVVTPEGAGFLVDAEVAGRQEQLRVTARPGALVVETRCGGKPISTRRWESE
jgi:hypothetical protein